jgi:hypothetical protein
MRFPFLLPAPWSLPSLPSLPAENSAVGGLVAPDWKQPAHEYYFPVQGRLLLQSWPSPSLHSAMGMQLDEAEEMEEVEEVEEAEANVADQVLDPTI